MFEVGVKITPNLRPKYLWKSNLASVPSALSSCALIPTFNVATSAFLARLKPLVQTGAAQGSQSRSSASPLTSASSSRTTAVRGLYRVSGSPRRLVTSHFKPKSLQKSHWRPQIDVEIATTLTRTFWTSLRMADSTEPIAENAAAPAGVVEPQGLLVEQSRAAPVGLSLTITNMSKMMNDIKFVRKLKELGIKYAKADKPFGKPAGKIRFENQEDRAAALEALNGKEIDGLVWQVRLPADMGGELGGTVHSRVGGRGGDRRQNKNASKSDDKSDEEGEVAEGGDGEATENATNVKDAVSPWHVFDLDTQRRKKYRGMREILEKISKRVKKDAATMPEWLVPILKQKTKWLACPLEQVIPSPITEGYRNKTELTVGLDVNGKPAIGFLLGAMKDGIVAVGDPREALSVSPLHAQIHQMIEPFVTTSGIPVWSRNTHTGFWRLCLIRSTINEDSLVMFQINSGAVTPEQLEKIKNDFVKFVTESDHPIKDKIKSIWFQDHSGVSNAAPLDAPKHLVWGREYLEEEMLGAKFRISPTSFFQVNTPAASLLYDLVRQWCGPLDENTTLFDVCCGTGTIGLCIAKNSSALKEIVGLEIVEDAVLDARANAELNGITNARFIVGKAEDTINQIVSEYPDIKKKIVVSATEELGSDGASADTPKHSFVAVLDPPRAGMHPKVLKAIRECEAITRVVYVSCNPNSLISDASLLTRTISKSTSGTPFVPVKARPVDLFPHTPHTELVMMFQRNTKEADDAIKASQYIADNPLPHIPRAKRGHSEVAEASDDEQAPTNVPEQPANQESSASSSMQETTSSAHTEASNNDSKMQQ